MRLVKGLGRDFKALGQLTCSSPFTSFTTSVIQPQAKHATVLVCIKPWATQVVGGWQGDDHFGAGDAVPRAPAGGGRFASLDERPIGPERLEFLQLNAARLRM